MSDQFPHFEQGQPNSIILIRAYGGPVGNQVVLSQVVSPDEWNRLNVAWVVANSLADILANVQTLEQHAELQAVVMKLLANSAEATVKRLFKEKGARRECPACEGAGNQGEVKMGLAGRYEELACEACNGTGVINNGA